MVVNANIRPFIMRRIVNTGIGVCDVLVFVELFEGSDPSLPAVNGFLNGVGSQSEDAGGCQELSSLSDEKNWSAASSQVTARYSACMRAPNPLFSAVLVK